MQTLVSFLLLAASGSAAQAALSVERPSDRVVVASSDPWATNVVGVKTDDGVVVVDTHQSPSIARRCRAAIEEAFPGVPLRYVINTHSHLDHAGGNRAFADVPIVAHDGARPLQDPAEMIEWAKHVVQNERGRAHSSSDLLVHFPKENVLVVSSLLIHDQLPGGYVTDEWDVPQWLAALDAVLSTGTPDIVVSGHQAPLSGEELLRARDYLGRLWSAVLEQRAAGHTLEQAQQELRLQSFSPELTSLRQKNWKGQEIHPRNVELFWRCAERLGS